MLFLLSPAHQKKMLNLSTQFKLSKELCIFEIRAVFTELQFSFLNHSLAYMSARELNYADNWNFMKIYSFSIIGASGIHNLSFLRNFEF